MQITHLQYSLYFFIFRRFALLAVLYSVILIKLKKQVFPGEQSANAEEHRARRNRNVPKMAIAILLGSVMCWAPYSVVVLLRLFFCMEQYISFLWHHMPAVLSYCVVHSLRKLCHKPLYLFYLQRKLSSRSEEFSSTTQYRTNIAKLALYAGKFQKECPSLPSDLLSDSKNAHRMWCDSPE